MQAAERGVKCIRLHLLTDGRDCTDGSSVKLMQVVVNKCGELQKQGCDAKVASGGGRMKVTMDRYEASLCELCSAHASEVVTRNAWTPTSPLSPQNIGTADEL